MHISTTSKKDLCRNVTFPVSEVRIYFFNSKNSSVYFARDIVNLTSKAFKDTAKETQRLCHIV